MIDWPTAAVIISITLGAIGAFVSIWTTRKTKQNGQPDLLLQRVERLEKQLDLMLTELLKIVRD